MPLVVRCQRKEGFKQAISIRLLDTPPGVSASTAVSIPEGKTEAEIPLSANGKASLGTFPLTVIASTRYERNAVVTVASDFVPLEVADRLFEFQFTKTMAEQGKAARS